jgi:MFS family permease
MKWFTKLLDRQKRLTNAIVRYPLTELFLLAAAVIVSVSINAEKDYEKLLLACVVGAVLCASLQALYERFFYKIFTRLILMVCGVTLTLGYYLILRSAPELSMEIGIRTSVALLALYFAFIWVPVIRSRISFNESFMAVFKAFFHSAFYSAVLYGGCSLIILAINTLIVNVNYKAYPHTANIVFTLFAPLFFLSLIPVYPGKKNKDMDSEKTFTQEEVINKAAFCPKFLEILISYIIIPLTAVFTIILLLYMVLNIRGSFWTNNLMEPMLVSYAITVIFIYILSSRLENKFAVLFRLIFPKLLVPIVLFQITSSIISLSETGVTHTRYFVILFGIFAACSGIVMSLLLVRKNGIIAAMLIAFSFVSIIPPVDAFTVSRLSQENILKSVLIQNGMLKNNTITPNSSVSNEDKKKIISLVEYLTMMGYSNKIEWLPDNFTVYEDFYDTFGFYEYDLAENTNRSINFFLNSSVPIDIAGYDVLTHTYINSDENKVTQICDIKKSGKNYILEKEKSGEKYDIVLIDDNKQEIIRFDTNEIFSKYRSYAVDKAEISNEEATFSIENDQVKLTIVVQDVNINDSFNQTYYYANFYILVQFK